MKSVTSRCVFIGAALFCGDGIDVLKNTSAMIRIADGYVCEEISKKVALISNSKC